MRTKAGIVTFTSNWAIVLLLVLLVSWWFIFPVADGIGNISSQVWLVSGIVFLLLTLFVIKSYYKIQIQGDVFHMQGFGKHFNWQNIHVPLKDLMEVYVGMREHFPLRSTYRSSIDLHVVSRDSHYLFGCGSISEEDIAKLQTALEDRGVAFNDRRAKNLK